MKTKLINLWEVLHTSFWFLPALMSFAAIGLSFATVADRRRSAHPKSA